MVCAQKVSAQAGCNTFEDITNITRQFIKYVFSEGDWVQADFDHYENEISIKAEEQKH